MKLDRKRWVPLILWMWPLVYFTHYFLPVQDAWAHFYTIFSFFNINASPWKEFLIINKRPYAGWFMDALMVPFVYLFGYRVGITVFFVLLSFVLMLSFYRYVYSISHNRGFALSTSLLMGINVYLIKGFFAFMGGLVLLVNMLVFLNRQDKIKYWLYLIVGEFFLHPFFFAEVLLLVFWRFFVSLIFRIKREYTKFVLLSPVIIVGGILGFIKLMKIDNLPFSWNISFIERIRLLLLGGYLLPWYGVGEGNKFFVGYSIGLTTIFLSYLVIRVVRGIIYTQSNPVDNTESKIKLVVILTSITNFVLFFVIFDTLKTGSYVHTRQIFVAFVLLLPMLPIYLKKEMNKFVQVYIFTIFLVELYFIYINFNRFDERFKYGTKVASLYIPKNSVVLSYTRFKEKGSFAYPGVHMGGAIGILTNSLYANNIDFLTTYQPLMIKNAHLYMDLSSGRCKKISESHLDYVFVYTNNKEMLKKIVFCSRNNNFKLLTMNDSLAILKNSCI